MSETEEDYLQETFAFAKAEISTHPDLGFLTLRLVRFETYPTNGLALGLMHRLRPEHVEDLIDHLRASLDQYRNSKGPDSLQSKKH
jgi:hypothetical protein